VKYVSLTFTSCLRNQKIKIKTLQNAKLKLYRYDIYKVSTYSQKEWLELPKT